MQSLPADPKELILAFLKWCELEKNTSLYRNGSVSFVGPDDPSTCRTRKEVIDMVESFVNQDSTANPRKDGEDARMQPSAAMRNRWGKWGQ